MTKLLKVNGVKGKGKYVKVDDEDYEYLLQFNWYLTGGYASRKDKKGKGNYESIRMHRELMNVTSGKVVDHINGDTLDNRKENLRICTFGQNSKNQTIRSTNNTGFKGVATDRGINRWRAAIGYDGNKKWIGRFTSPEEAARAYDYYALKYHGEYARLNFPDEIPTKPNPLQKKKTSKYKGVHYDKRDKKWISQIRHNRKTHTVGTFDSEIEAALAYNKMAIELRGEDAVINDVEESGGDCIE